MEKKVIPKQQHHVVKVYIKKSTQTITLDCVLLRLKSLLRDFNCVIIKLDSLLNWAAAQSDKARSIELIPWVFSDPEEVNHMEDIFSHVTVSVFTSREWNEGVLAMPKVTNDIFSDDLKQLWAISNAATVLKGNWFMSVYVSRGLNPLLEKRL